MINKMWISCGWVFSDTEEELGESRVGERLHFSALALWLSKALLSRRTELVVTKQTADTCNHLPRESFPSLRHFWHLDSSPRDMVLSGKAELQCWGAVSPTGQAHELPW